jgi:transcription termination/antitermination protein NusA
MGRLKLDTDILGLGAVMEKITRARVKDCFKEDETIYFIVGSGELGKAVGKGGASIKKVQEELGKKIKVIEFRSNLSDFVRNVIFPHKVEKVIEEEGIVKIKESNKKTKSLLIGRDGKNLKLINRAVKRFFNVNEVIVE